MKKVVSVSLGSSRRDHKVEAEFFGEPFTIERIGTDGDMGKAIGLIKEFDGNVDAIGLGGIDLYLVAGKRKYIIRDAQKLASAAQRTPVVDGSGLKNTLERETIRYLANEKIIEFKNKKALLPSAVDRFGMAEALVEAGCKTIFGDLIFALGIPIALKSLTTVRILAFLLLPIICRLPFEKLYPTGEKQEKIEPKYTKYYNWADIIAGDFLFIRRYMPQEMAEKIIITNTVTADDVAALEERGVKLLVTTTPEIGGRSFGTNVMEGVLVALCGKRPEELKPEDYMESLKQLGWQPRVERLEAG